MKRRLNYAPTRGDPWRLKTPRFRGWEEARENRGWDAGVGYPYGISSHPLVPPYPSALFSKRKIDAEIRPPSHPSNHPRKDTQK